MEKRLSACKVMVCLIGPGWLDARNEGGARRLDDLKDWVRLEIERALARGLTVIPVLVEGAYMPKAEDLPDTLKPLVDRHAVSITTNSFRSGMAGLTRDIRAIAGGAPWRWIGAGAGASALAAAAVLALSPHDAMPTPTPLPRETPGSKAGDAPGDEKVEIVVQDVGPLPEPGLNTPAEQSRKLEKWQLFMNGEFHSKMQDHDHAIADFTKAIELDPNYAEAYQKRGDAYKAKGNTLRASADYKRAKELGYK
ncbi:MAG: tetratricopeptide repeat protein [Rhodomicrobium sp.]